MRLHQRIGIWLLLWPCWWALGLAGKIEDLPRLFFLFLIGAVVMRSAGCIVNDMWDREIDAQVARTKHRPLASGELSLTQAAVLLIVLLAIGLAILLNLHPFSWPIALGFAVLAVLYPLAKRVMAFPQLMLGISFNGALAGFAAASGNLPPGAFLLYGACFFWILGYDTIYAHQDKRDDVKLGIGSSALLFGGQTRGWLLGFYGLMLGLLGLSGWAMAMGWIFYLSLPLLAFHLGWQLFNTDFNQPASCLRAFRANGWLGWLFLIPILLDRIAP